MPSPLGTVFVEPPPPSVAPVPIGLVGVVPGSTTLFPGAFTHSNCLRKSICSAVIKLRFATRPIVPPPFNLLIGPNKNLLILFYPVLPNANFLPFNALTLSIIGSLLSPISNL